MHEVEDRIITLHEAMRELIDTNDQLFQYKIRLTEKELEITQIQDEILKDCELKDQQDDQNIVAYYYKQMDESDQKNGIRSKKKLQNDIFMIESENQQPNINMLQSKQLFDLKLMFVVNLSVKKFLMQREWRMKQRRSRIWLYQQPSNLDMAVGRTKSMRMEDSKQENMIDSITYQKGSALRIVDLESKQYEEKRKQKQQSKKKNIDRSNLEKYGQVGKDNKERTIANFQMPFANYSQKTKESKVFRKEGKEFQPIDYIFQATVDQKEFEKPKKNYDESIKSKQRHFFKTEHHKYDYDENTARVYNKEETIRSKGINEKEYLLELMFRRDFAKYMLETYQILPQLIDKKKVKKFIAEIQMNKKYQNHIDNWNQQSKDQKVIKYFKLEYEASQQLHLLTDLTMPHEWFPEARQMKRKFIYHMGPTNSGKTRGAIQRLMESRNGIYCAPLRLLAWEISEKLSNNGIACSLLTGQERQMAPDSTHLSCTIEMTDLQNEYDVAVIDEIQLIEDPDRGSAWTNCILGLKAKEIHICGEERALKLIHDLVQDTEDDLEVKQYTRLSTLNVEHQSVKSFNDFKPGDCIVAFGRRSLFQIKNSINSYYKNKNGIDTNYCAIIYGALPPETKKTQAFMFNNRASDIKYLLATDAVFISFSCLQSQVGMGLNLNISRVIFTTLEKSVKGQKTQITNNQLKQIAGRAGRYIDDGFVTAFKQKDLQRIRQVIGSQEKAKKRTTQEQNEDSYEFDEYSLRESTEVIDNILNLDDTDESDQEINLKISRSVIQEDKVEGRQSLNEVIIENVTSYSEQSEQEKVKKMVFTPNQKDIQKACLFPNFNMIQQFASDLELQEQKRIHLSEVIQKFESLAQLGKKYFAKDTRDICQLSDALEGIPGLEIKDHFNFSLSPLKTSIKTKDKIKLITLRNMAIDYVDYGTVRLPDNFTLSNELFQREQYNENDLEVFERIHNILEVYLWLSNKYPQAFVETDLCNILVEKVCKIIDQILLSKHQNSLFSNLNDGLN
ncbi:atp-dependent rna helicase mitochondrial-like [Stylonychia lemnae]|uniref:RNA helicase n=1 Tax=Stylonychia lemnae TaxID=5949 RepID=A0A078AMQ3_STYLE|nr:atp-dependent rna helicase mitochondrial-like [Stylonychia lemnae]|eukprot:CDW83196.1 atp-dependent rna helicase mitochondrial-like [Stylonychia lemnae]